MNDSRKEKLIALGVEKLADALLSLSTHSDEADDLVGQLVATPEENILRFKKKLSNLQHSRRFIDWRASSAFALELEMLLKDLEAGIDRPFEGVKLVASFYEADSTIFEMCDDSSGSIGDVFRCSAKELFMKFATRCDDKEKIADIILKVNKKNDYGVRDTLIDCAGECLPEKVIRRMISKLHKWADEEDGDYARRSYLFSIESLAKQIKDAELFEKTRVTAWGKLSTASFIDIAQIYFDCGNVEVAYSWLKKIPEGETFKSYERDELLKKIYMEQGNDETLAELLLQKLKSCHCIENLEQLLNVIGSEKRDEVIANEVGGIVKDANLNEVDAQFLIEVGEIDVAEGYLIKRADQLNGNYYGTLLSLAETMEEQNRNLVTSLIYRSLLLSILERGYTKAYSYGVKYLKKLDVLKSTLSDWKGFDSHEVFKKQLLQSHGRKRSFWSKYN